jgi:hypothetical protein
LANLVAIGEGYHWLIWLSLGLYGLAFLSFPPGLSKLAPSWRRP